MSDSQKYYYISVDEINKLSDVEFRRRINRLNTVVNEQTNTSKTTDKVWYDSFDKLLHRWKDVAEKRNQKSSDKKDLDAFTQITNAIDKYTKYTENDDSVEKDLQDGDPLSFSDPGIVKEPGQKTKYRGGDQKTTPPSGETYTVKPTVPLNENNLKGKSQQEVIQNYNKVGATKVDKIASVNVALENARDLGPKAEGASSPDEAINIFLKNATYDDMIKELSEISQAKSLLQQASKDKVINENRFRNQFIFLQSIETKIRDNPTYKFKNKEAGPQMRVEDGEKLDLPPLRSSTEEPIPEQVQPELKSEAPQGQVSDIPLTGSNLVQEANNYINEINKIPAFRLNSEMINIRKELQDAIKEPINQEKLKQSVAKARQFFQNIDQNLNRVPDRAESAGRAIDQGLDDMKKIEEQNKEAKEAKTKLTDLRPEAKEGEQERVKKNFNKDVLELKTANDVLKSKVNIQREEIKVLKETIEQKLKKENDEMMASVAPVFRHYLSLDIENVVQEDEAQEQVYYSVI